MIVERHYDDETLVGLLGTRADARDPHLSVCSSCSDAFASYRAISDVLGDAVAWDLRELPSEPSAETLTRLALATRQTAEEDSEAVSLVNELLARSRSSWSTVTRTELRYQTTGVARRLVEVSESIIDRDPHTALDVAAVATEIAERLEVSASLTGAVARARSAAWRQYGYALFYTGDMPKALDAAERAERALDGSPVPDYDLARIGIVRSLIYAVQERHDESLAVARQAARTFRSFGDGQRLASALNAEAYVLLSQSRYREALPVLLDIQKKYATHLDLDSRARVATNLGLCYWQTGRVADGLHQYQTAAAMYDELGTATEAARVRLNVAGLLAAEGHHAEAKHRLRKVQGEFERLGMHRDVVSTGLILAEVLLAEGLHGQAEELCRVAIEQFQRMGLSQTSDGLTALMYLREAISAKATPEAARHVRRYFERLSHEPSLLFAPPPPA